MFAKKSNKAKESDNIAYGQRFAERGIGCGFGRGAGRGSSQGRGLGKGRRFSGSGCMLGGRLSIFEQQEQFEQKNYQATQQAASVQPMMNATQPTMNTAQPIMDAETCPLCENHCPLSNPGCGKGLALAKSRSKIPS